MAVFVLFAFGGVWLDGLDFGDFSGFFGSFAIAVRVDDFGDFFFNSGAGVVSFAVPGREGVGDLA